MELQHAVTRVCIRSPLTTLVVVCCQIGHGSDYELTAKSDAGNNNWAEERQLPAPGVALPTEAERSSFELTSSLYFDGTYVATIAKSDIETLRNASLDRSVPMSLYDGEPDIRAKTCNEFDALLEAGYQAGANANAAASSNWVWFHQVCGMLEKLRSASVPEVSFVSSPRVGVFQIDLLPVELFPWKPDEEPRDLNMTYQNKVWTDVLEVFEVGHDVLTTVRPSRHVQTLQEIVRADFNRDGIEDILCFETITPHWGNTFGGQILVLTRRSASGKFAVVETAR